VRMSIDGDEDEDDNGAPNTQEARFYWNSGLVKVVSIVHLKSSSEFVFCVSSFSCKSLDEFMVRFCVVLFQ